MDKEQLYRSRHEQMLVKDPWNDMCCVKNGLVMMYVSTAISELIGLKAELHPSIKLNTINPEFIKYLKLLKKCLEDKTMESYLCFLKFLEDYLNKPLNVVRWKDYKPDIRVVDTIEEALGCLQTILHLDT